jgi:ribonuclease-3
LNLGQGVLTGKQTVGSKRDINDRLLEDVFESLIGAIYLDLGFKSAETFIIGLIEPNIDIYKIASADDNYKDLLMRYTQINGYELPIYKTTEASGKPHNRTFTVTVALKKTNSDRIIDFGTGHALTKKEAEQNACKDAICFNKIHNCTIHNYNSAKLHLDDIHELMNRDVTHQ